MRDIEEYYYKRLKILNQTSNKTVLDCIDRPIRELVLELNRVGLTTRFSCCGFPYKDEEEPKSHAKFPFVILEDPSLSSNKTKSISAFFGLGQLAKLANWVLEPYLQGQWHLNAEKLVKMENSFYRKEEEERGIHDYESLLITIQAMTKTISKWPSIGDQFTITDGNQNYAKNTNNEWQVEPKQSITLEIHNENNEG